MFPMQNFNLQKSIKQYNKNPDDSSNVANDNEKENDKIVKEQEEKSKDEYDEIDNDLAQLFQTSYIKFWMFLSQYIFQSHIYAALL